MRIVHVNTTIGELSYEKLLWEKYGAVLECRNCETPEEVVSFARDAEIILFTRTLFDRALLSSLPALRLLVRYGVGYDNVDLDAAAELGIQV